METFSNETRYRRVFDIVLRTPPSVDHRLSLSVASYKHLELTAPNDRYELLVHTAPTTNDSHRLTMYQLTACHYLKQQLSSS